jgi:hypothetical protein
MAQEQPTKTESEKYFEAFCDRNGFKFDPVPTGPDRTPDYTLTVGGEVIVVEVKEVHQTPEELESLRVMKERGVGLGVHITPGKTVRKKIADCSLRLRPEPRALSGLTSLVGTGAMRWRAYRGVSHPGGDGWVRTGRFQCSTESIGAETFRRR